MTGQPMPPPTNEELKRAVLHLTRAVLMLRDTVNSSLSLVDKHVEYPGMRNIIYNIHKIDDELKKVVDEIVKDPPDHD